MFQLATTARHRKERKCGAIALYHAYLRLGLYQDMDSIWSRIATLDRQGNWGAASHRLAEDAMRLGLESLVIKLKTPALVLERFDEYRGIQFIACHRLRPGSSLGHFSLLDSVDDTMVRVTTNIAGDAKEFPRAEFLKLWQDHASGDEFGAKVLVAISQRNLMLDGDVGMGRWKDCGEPPSQSQTEKISQLCHTSIPTTANCLRCGIPFSLRLLQRIYLTGTQSADQRGWDAIFCPHCDAAHR